MPLGKAKDKLLEDLKKAIRESGPCIMSGVQKNCGGFMQGSHILSEGAYPNLKLDPRNITPMCYTHHIHVWHKSPMDAAEWFKKNYLKQWEYLTSVKKCHIDWTIDKVFMLRTALKKSLSEYMDAYESIRPLP